MSSADTTRAFRDPPSRRDHRDALVSRLASALVGAPQIPIELKRYGLRLLDVRPGRRGAIELVLGHEDPIAVMRLTPRTATDAVPIGGGAARVAVEELHGMRPSDRASLDEMAQRLDRATTPARWGEAIELAQALRAVSHDVPMAHYRQHVEGCDGVGLVRVGFGCNQDCGLCWQDRDWPRFSAEQVLTWISDLSAHGARQLILSGGEPMLDAALPRYIEHARALGLDVTLETNAIQASKPEVAERLAQAGLSHAFVSLHSAEPAISDAITRAPGTHLRTIAGIHALLRAGIDVRFNCVMVAEGLAGLPELPAFLDRELSGYRREIRLMFSYPTDAFDPKATAAMRPDPDALRVALRAAVDRAIALGIVLDGIDGPCGPPLCAHGADRRIVALQPVEPLSFRTFVAACEGCAVRHACPGVRAGDVATFGERVARPIASVPASGERAPSS